MSDELNEWREYASVNSWKKFDDKLAGLVYHRNKGNLSGLQNDLMRMIDFLAARVKDLEAEKKVAR